MEFSATSRASAGAITLSGDFSPAVWKGLNSIQHLSIEGDATKYNITWTKSGDVIDSFIPEIFTFEECS